jgi:hypothetical protein
MIHQEQSEKVQGQQKFNSHYTIKTVKHPNRLWFRGVFLALWGVVACTFFQKISR